jgi:hypothetical protein
MKTTVKKLILILTFFQELCYILINFFLPTVLCGNKSQSELDSDALFVLVSRKMNYKNLSTLRISNNEAEYVDVYFPECLHMPVDCSQT